MRQPLRPVCEAIVAGMPASNRVLEDLLRERGREATLESTCAPDVLEALLKLERLPAVLLHRLACAFAELVLPYWEARFPRDPRPRRAVESKRAWLAGEIGTPELDEAWWQAAKGAEERYGPRPDPAFCAAWRAADSNPSSAAWEAAWHAASLTSWDELLLIAGQQLDQADW